MPALQDSHIVKIAVELENMTAQLIEFDQRDPLTRKFLNVLGIPYGRFPSPLTINHREGNRP